MIIQTIDNDMRCDGSDPDNYGPYGQALDEVLTHIEDAIPGVRFIVSQPITVQRWTTWAARHPQLVQDNSGTGPCQVFDKRGSPRPTGIRSLQRIVDSYWAEIESVYAAHPGCFTDGGAEQAKFLPADRYVAVDHNHASLEGHQQFAAIAWRAFPDEIKRLP